MYLQYNEYLEFGGTIEDEQAFERYEYRARMLVDNLTCRRIRDETPVRECVKRLMYELICVIQEQVAGEQRAAAGIASQSNDGVSVSYDSGAARNNGYSGVSAEVICQQLIAQYLAGEVDGNGVCLLYRGVG